MMLTARGETGDAGARAPGTRADGVIVLLIALCSLAVRAAVAQHLDVFQDEGLYWWQGHEGISFSPHPPGVPALVRAGEAVFGDRLLGIRAASLLSATASIFLCYLLARDLFGRRAGLWAAALFAVCPLFVGAGTIATPDAPLVFLWLLMMWTTWRAVQSSRALWWAAVAGVLAAGLYVKYMMVLAVPAVLVAMWLAPRGRAALRRRAPWLALALGVGLFLPVFLLWNWQHGWPTLRYHLVARHEWTPAFWKFLPRYLGEHAAALSPVLYVALLASLVAAWRSRRLGEEGRAWVVSFALVPIVFFLPVNLFTKPQLCRVQWDEIGYAAGVVALAGVIASATGPRPTRRWRRAGVAALAVALAVNAAAVAACLTDLGAALGLPSPARQAEGWRELAERIEALAADRTGRPPIVVTISFRTAVCLGFHLDRREDIYTLHHRRHDRYGVTQQLNEWGIDEEHLRRELGVRDPILVVRGGPPVKRNLASIRRCFESHELLEIIRVPRGSAEPLVFLLYRAVPYDPGEAGEHER